MKKENKDYLKIKYFPMECESFIITYSFHARNLGKRARLIKILKRKLK